MEEDEGFQTSRATEGEPESKKIKKERQVTWWRER
jgi:hypothetical protein